jgi:hypothetical protein
MCSVDWNAISGGITALATLSLAVVALLALTAAKGQIEASRQIAALQMFNDVFKLEIENKELADGTKDFATSEQLCNDKSYSSFMAFMLVSYEQIIETQFGKPYYNGWRESMKFNLGYHLGYFIDKDGDFAADRFHRFYDNRLVEILREIVEEAANAQA